MDGDEDIRLNRVGDVGPLDQTDVCVVGPGHNDVVAVTDQDGGHLFGDGQVEVLFSDPLVQRAGQSAAVSGVQHHNRGARRNGNAGDKGAGAGAFPERADQDAAVLLLDFHIF